MEGKVAFKTTTRILRFKDGTEKELVVEEDKLIDKDSRIIPSWHLNAKGLDGLSQLTKTILNYLVTNQMNLF